MHRIAKYKNHKWVSLNCYIIANVTITITLKTEMKKNYGDMGEVAKVTGKQCSHMLHMGCALPA
jgi:hypothetical protein